MREDEVVTVRELVDRMAMIWKGPELKFVDGSFPETSLLRVDSTKARDCLGWKPPLDLDATIDLTASWYRGYYANPASARELTESQIQEYRRRL